MLKSEEWAVLKKNANSSTSQNKSDVHFLRDIFFNISSTNFVQNWIKQLQETINRSASFFNFFQFITIFSIFFNFFQFFTFFQIFSISKVDTQQSVKQN